MYLNYKTIHKWRNYIIQSEAAAVACKLTDLTCEKSRLTDANTFSNFYLHLGNVSFILLTFYTVDGTLR